MHFLPLLPEFEILAQRLTKQVEVVTLHWQAAAFRRRLGSERTDDQVAAGA